MPAIGGVDINVYRTELGAEVLAFENEACGPQTSGDRGLLKNPDFNIRDNERFALDKGRLDRRNPLLLVDELAMRKRASEVITVNAMKESTAAQLNGAPGFSFEADDFRSEEHTSELQSQSNLVCRLLLEKKKNNLKTLRHT